MTTQIIPRAICNILYKDLTKWDFPKSYANLGLQFKILLNIWQDLDEWKLNPQIQMNDLADLWPYSDVQEEME